MEKAQVPEDVGAKKDKKEKKEKKRKAHDEIDLLSCPASIIIESSGQSKFDGAYKLMPDLYNGRPAYQQEPSGKDADASPNFLFCQKKWQLSISLGDKKFRMYLEDVGLAHPCEPYPRAWRRFEKDSSGGKTEVIAHAMRVIDASFAGALNRDRDILSKIPFNVSSSSGGVKRKRKIAAAVPTEAGAETASGNAPADPAGTQAEASVSASADSKGAGPASGEAAAEDEDDSDSESDDAGKEEEGATGSEEDSDDSSSSSASAKKEVAVPAEVARDKMASAIELKLREQLTKLKGHPQIRGKFKQLKDQILNKGSAVAKASIVPQALIEEIMAKLEAEFIPPPAKPPPGPPPAHLMKKPNAGNAASATGPPKVDTIALAAKARIALPHRTLKPPTRSKLKSAMAAPRVRQPHERVHMQGFGELQQQKQVPVDSYRSYGASLWFQMPGSTVTCDSCSVTVAQAQGALQGAPTRSQFAQDRFICCNCMGNEQGPAP